MEKTSYNLDAKIKLYDDRFKFVFEKLETLLSQNNVTPPYIEEFRLELKQFRKDMESIQIGGNTTTIKHLEDIYQEVLRLHNQLQDKIDQDKEECTDYQRNMNTQLKKTYDYCKDQLKVFKTYLSTMNNNITDNTNNIKLSSQEFNSAIGNTSSELTKKIDQSKEEVETRIDSLDNTVNQRIDNLSNVLTSKISDSKNELTTKIETNNTEISSLKLKQTELSTKVDALSGDTTVIDQKIDEAKTDFAGKLNSVKLEINQSINDKISDVNSKIADYDTVKTTVDDNTSKINEVETKLTNDLTALETKVNTHRDNQTNKYNNLAARMDTVETTLVDNKSELTSDIDTIKQTIANDMSMLQNDLDQKLRDFINDKLYPIGSIFQNVRNVDPNTILGTSFTWKRLDDDTKLISYTGDNLQGESEGSNTLSVNHQHRIDMRFGEYYSAASLNDTGTTTGLPRTYSGQNPTSWSGRGSLISSPTLIINAGAEPGAKSIPAMSMYQMTGVSAPTTLNIDVKGKVCKVNTFIRIA